ncbi:MAG: AraC family transcriptional regulator [Verrucomicrobiota bacterium]
MKSRILPSPSFSNQVRDSLYCHLVPGVTLSQKVKILCAGREKVLPTYQISRKKFVCYGLEFVAEGRGKLRFKNKTQEIGPGDLFLYGPTSPHEILTDPQRPLIKYFVDFFGNESTHWFKQCGLKPEKIIRIAELESTRDLFENLIREGRKPTSARNLICLDYLHLIFLKARTSISSRQHYSSRAFEVFEKSRRLIESRFRELKSLQDLGREMKMDPSHLCRLYQRFREDSPYASLVRKKMDVAAELLVTRQILIKEAAHAVGFEDPFHFSRIFTRYFGESPKAFVKKHMRD